MKKIRELLVRYREIVSYIFWGGMTTIVSWGSYTLAAMVFRKHTETFSVFGVQMSVVVLTASVLSWICAFLFAFVANKLWVFQSKSWKISVCLPEFGKFFSARAITGVLEIIAVPLLVGLGLDQTIFGVEGIFAKILVSILVVLLNYVFSKLFIFKEQS